MVGRRSCRLDVEEGVRECGVERVEDDEVVSIGWIGW